MYEIFDNEKDNLEILEAYHNMEHMKLEMTGNKAKQCYIFFTSHGLYYPTTIENFKHKVLEQDRYEWVNISKNSAIWGRASELIFVRDIYKNWCIQGINGTINSMDKLYERLKTLTEGREIITVGSSAGGFMAILFGTLLKAKTIYAFSPQVSLSRYHGFHPINYFEEYLQDPGVVKYMELAPLMKEYTGNLFYFYPNACPEDVDQYEVVKDLEHIHVFSVNQKQHGVTFHGDSIIKILTMSPQSLIIHGERYRNKKINPDLFLLRTTGLGKCLLILVGKRMKKIFGFLRQIFWRKKGSQSSIPALNVNK